MDKNLFIEVLQHYSKCSEGEAVKVIGLKEDFPYCQLLHALSARLSKDHGLVDQSRELQLAAVYAADRGVLKDVMTLDNIVVEYRYTPKIKTSGKSLGTPKVATATMSPVTNAVESVVSSESYQEIGNELEQPLNEETTPVNEGPIHDDTPESGTMAEQVLNDLEKLHQLKHNFEMMFIDGGASDIKVLTEPISQKEPVAAVIGTVEVAEDGLQSAKSKRERIIELARALEASKKAEASEEAKVPPVRAKRTNPGENIIEEIVSTKHEIEPESPKQKEQLEIIEHFIKTQPSIANSKDKPIPAPGADLSTIKTGEFSDNIVSETLVEILIKQGKKDKAIEVLKKLIWKFPQKKAYFAAQIEELKK